MKISVITVCWNAAATIRHTLQSFFAQDYPDKQLIIVDGASQDGTLEIVRSFPQNDVIVISEPDRGIYDAMNKGLNAFSGDAVGFLNADDRFSDPGALSAIAARLAEADIVFADLDIVDAPEQGKVVRRWRSSDFVPGAFAKGWMPAHPTFYCRRSVVERVGRFDLRYKVASDYDFMLRAMETETFRARRLDRVVVDMLQGGRSTSSLSSHLHHNLEALDARRRWLKAGWVDYALFAKPLRKVPQLFQTAS